MSHVIPRRVFQTLKSCRWDCNVCGVSRKMTKLNYVRLWGCEVGVWCLSAWALRRLPLGPFGAFCSGCAWGRPIPHGSSKMSHVIPLRVFQTLKSCRWDCNVCGVSRKMTKLNYVQLFGGAGLGRSWARGWERGLRASSSEPVQQRDVGERSGADAPQELAPAEQVDGDRHARGGQGHPPVVSRRVGVVCQRR